jgi:hypothetical protein
MWEVFDPRNPFEMMFVVRFRWQARLLCRWMRNSGTGGWLDYARRGEGWL